MPTDERVQVRLTPQPIDVNALLSEAADLGNGAYVVFLGVVRDIHQGREVLRIDYEAYEGMALKEMKRIAEEVAASHQLSRLTVVHRVGRHEIGDASLCIVAGSRHRPSAFEASREVVDRIKQDVPIWKREFFADGSIDWVLADKLVESKPAPGA